MTEGKPWQAGWRESAWQDLDQRWDILIIGGGITGAGILREATQQGLRALLVEQRDFAWGTSSRSSKLVHGGLRYLRQGRIRLTRTSVREREQLLDEAPGLVKPLGFLWATYKDDPIGRWVFEAGLSVYDLLALRWSHRYHDAARFRMLAPNLDRHRLSGGFAYGDAQTDDARLVLRLLQESVAEGACAINYVRAEELILGDDGNVQGALLHDVQTGRKATVQARLVVNATGAWADDLREKIQSSSRIRPLRGSHLIFPHWRLPVAQAVSFAHPLDGRPVFIVPWEGVTLVGTTDVDHEGGLMSEPRISPGEVAYLLAAVEAHLPALGIGLDDVLSTFAGVRPVVGKGNIDPSHESRDHAVWEEKGLLTVTGGKLTTFRIIARDALKQVGSRLPEVLENDGETPLFSSADGPIPGISDLDDAVQQRLWGRYGSLAPQVVAAARPGEMETIGPTDYRWVEVRWAARREAVSHLEDLLLRRVRVGLMLPGGGAAYFDRFRHICQEELGWNDERWHLEVEEYTHLWRCCYSLPDQAHIPDWKAMLQERRSSLPGGRRRFPWSLLAPLAGAISLFSLLLWMRRKR